MLMLRDESHLPASIWNEGFSVAAAMVAWLAKRPLVALQAWYEREQLIDHLTRMTDRQLEDVGFSRDQIADIVKGTHRKAPVAPSYPPLTALAAAEVRCRRAKAAPANDEGRRLAA